MTTIAFDGRYLAADGHGMRADMTTGLDTVKLAMGAAHVYAIVGTANFFDALVEWAEAGADPRDDDDSFPICHNITAEDHTCLVRVDVATRLSGCCLMSTPYFCEAPGAAAWGSGRAHALTAMDCGRNAMEAVCMAAQRDPVTKGVVRYIDLQDIEAGVQVWSQLAEASPPHFVERFHEGPMRDAVKSWFTEDKGGRINHALECDIAVTSSAGLKEPRYPPMARLKVEGMTTIIKPTKDVLTPGGMPVDRGWQPECTGGLIYHTGCGHCLRCNREWYALCKRWSRDGSLTTQVFSPDQLVTTMTEWRIGIDLPDVQPEPVADEPRAKLEAWVAEWNAASAAGNIARTQLLDVALRGMEFPEGCELVTKPGSYPGYTCKEIVWRDAG